MQVFQPFSPTDLHRDPAELEDFLLFAIAVAGHRAQQTRASLDRFYADKPAQMSPFAWVRFLDQTPGVLFSRIVACRFGIYGQLERAWREAANSGLDLRTCDASALRRLYRVGPKTAAFFLAHSRGTACAILDTHILRWLRALGHQAPKSTPTSDAKYQQWERVFLVEAARRHMNPVDLDRMIWTTMAAR